MPDKQAKTTATKKLAAKIGREFKAGYNRYTLLAVSGDGNTAFVRCANQKETMDAKRVENYFTGANKQ